MSRGRCCHQGKLAKFCAKTAGCCSSIVAKAKGQQLITITCCTRDAADTMTMKASHETIVASGAGLRGSAPGRQLQDCGSTTYPLFDMLECSPNWDYAAGGGILLLVASGMDAKLVKETCEQVQVMFDETQVCLLHWCACACMHACLTSVCRVHSAVSDVCVRLHQICIFSCIRRFETQRLLNSRCSVSVYLLAGMSATYSCLNDPSTFRAKW